MGYPCERCGGTGEEPDPRAIGKAMRVRRQAIGASLREVARRLDLSPSYVSDLEQGRRGWSPKMQGKYRDALQDLE